MNIKVWGASTLSAFTKTISEAFLQQGHTLDSTRSYQGGLAQIHGSPYSLLDDIAILKDSMTKDFPVIHLIHRPDEVILNEEVKSLLRNSALKFIMLGDLIFDIPFWSEKKDRCTVIPHPFTSTLLPPLTGKKTIGAFTSWGEMRSLDHYLKLVDCLKTSDQFEFVIGGTGLKTTEIPSHVQIRNDFFVPHFNVQLYHLNGHKRIGETSGSLHRGVSIPIIFEANGMEKIENMNVVKISANEDLSHVDFTTGANQIVQLASRGYDSLLLHNLKQAKLNTPVRFVQEVCRLF